MDFRNPKLGLISGFLRTLKSPGLRYAAIVRVLIIWPKGIRLLWVFSDKTYGRNYMYVDYSGMAVIPSAAKRVYITTQHDILLRAETFALLAKKDTLQSISRKNISDWQTLCT